MRVDLTHAMSDSSLKYTCREYGPHDLQRVGVWQFENQSQKPKDGHWIVYIHGGAWRDPKIDHLSFNPAINKLVDSGRAPPETVAGFASIDYRLSPHPDHPQDPATTPDASLRNAKHPDHIHDVQSALELLKNEYALDEKYIVVGHSAGATLAFQLLMNPSTVDIPLPSAIIGVSGIYDLVALNERLDGNYAGFLTSAFGGDKRDWNVASPVHYTDGFKKSWPSSRLATLAWSHEDSLIDEPEIESMAFKLIKDRVNVSITKDLTGDHNEVWEGGDQLARLISSAIRQLQEAS